MLDDEVPVPTLWTEDERLLLQGTSLEVRWHFPTSFPEQSNQVLNSSSRH